MSDTLSTKIENINLLTGATFRREGCFHDPASQKDAAIEWTNDGVVFKWDQDGAISLNRAGADLLCDGDTLFERFQAGVGGRNYDAACSINSAYFEWKSTFETTDMIASPSENSPAQLNCSNGNRLHYSHSGDWPC